MSSNSPDSSFQQLLRLAGIYAEHDQATAQEILCRQADLLGADVTNTQLTTAPLTRVQEGAKTCCAPGAESAMAASNEPVRLTEILLSSGLAVYLFLLALILCPQSLWRDRLIHPFAPFLGALGFWQSWNVFAPDIRKDNFHLLSVVTFSDGTEELWEFPRVDKLSGLAKMRAERFRKWANDRVRYGQFPYLLPDAARYIAHLYDDRKVSPTYVDLLLLSNDIPSHEDGFAVPLPPHSRVKTFYVYKVEADTTKEPRE